MIGVLGTKIHDVRGAKIHDVFLGAAINELFFRGRNKLDAAWGAKMNDMYWGAKINDMFWGANINDMWLGHRINDMFLALLLVRATLGAITVEVLVNASRQASW